MSDATPEKIVLISILLGIPVALPIGFLAGFTIADGLATHRILGDAIKANVAHYEVKDAGEVKFVWGAKP